MITLTTGLPGSGKTLYTISFVKELSERDNRPVFYAGIKDLTLPWHLIEAAEWMNCIEGAIIVIDECQMLFRPRGNGSQVPKYVSELETHRHKGFDIFLITQHPMLIDANVRRLTERHNHVCRRYGMQRATILQYESCKEQPLQKQESAQRLEWRYPASVFDLYKSAQVHTVKRRIPMIVWVLLALPFLIGGLIWYFMQRHSDVVKVPEKSDLVVMSDNASGQTSNKGRAKTPEEYLEEQTPRIPGLAYTAPIYDEVTKPTRAPVPVGAIVSKKGCKAYTDQGTPLEMPQDLCKQIAGAGFYRSFDNKPEERKDQPKPIESPKA